MASSSAGSKKLIEFPEFNSTAASTSSTSPSTSIDFYSSEDSSTTTSSSSSSLSREEQRREDEALRILLQLDQVLNECLKNEDGRLLAEDDINCESLEECLKDLDEYLKLYDDAELPKHRDLENGLFRNSGSESSLLRRSFVCSPRRSSASRLAGLIRNHAYRQTIGPITYSTSSSAGTNECEAMNDGGESTTTAPAGCIDNPSSSPIIAARDRISDEPTIPISNETAVVGVASVAAVGVDHSQSAEPVGLASMANKRPQWLRTSMRRLQPLELPLEQQQHQQQQLPSEVANLNHLVGNLTPRDTSATTARPYSAPSRIASSRSRSTERAPGGAQTPRARSSSASSRSRRPRSLSSSVSSVPSSVDSSPSCTPTPETIDRTGNSAPQSANTHHRTCDRSHRNSNSDMPEMESPLGQWPHSLSSTLAYVGCTLGIFNISRFAILSLHFGANFIIQFLLISLLIGIPIFTLHLCLGQQLAAGVIDMWRISPMFQGVGVSLLFFQTLTGLYSIVGISWMFVYFRDSFVTRFERYRWAEPFVYYRNEIQLPINGTYKLSETVPDYLSGIVFQRHHLVSGPAYGTIKFQPAFNLVVVWMIVFVSLSKGLRSYGKVIYVFTLVPIFGLFILCAKMLGMMPNDMIGSIFPDTSWSEFFINSRSWLAACQEAFLTWGMMGAAVMQIASHNKNKKLLQRDSSLIIFITITVLILAAMLANTCVQILKINGYTYQPDSFEKMSTYTFIRHKNDPLPPNVASTPVRYMPHYSFIVGDRVIRPGIDPSSESGYQVLRFATELVPATFAILGTEHVSPFWTVLFYFVLILFGIAQQLAIWHCVITGIMAIKAKVLKSWETTITFFSCAAGFLLGLPMTTEYGIYVVYFMDLTIGGLWWLIVVVLLMLVAVFMVRGRPYSGDILVTALFKNFTTQNCMTSWLPVLLSFTWNVILPVVLMIWCITFFKNGNFRELFIWHHGNTLGYWPLWARQIGSLLQLMPILGIPFIAVIQSYRYLNNGPADILERIQLLYRPPLGEHMDDLAIQEAAAASMNNNTTTTISVAEDPPPKYTPPPSYTTATGARIAKMLRQSFRRSVRRIASVIGEASGSRSSRPNNVSSTEQGQRPPDYNDVLVEINHRSGPNVDNRSTMIHRELATIASSSNGQLTAADVACILRSSFRRSTVRNHRRHNQQQQQQQNGVDQTLSSLSAENLIDSAAPLGETSLVLMRTEDKDRDTTSLSVI